MSGVAFGSGLNETPDKGVEVKRSFAIGFMSSPKFSLHDKDKQLTKLKILIKY